jgi:ANTAR domain
MNSGVQRSDGRTRTLDKAEGILMLVRRCDSATAFTELVQASVRHRLVVSELAAALVNLAADMGGRCDTRATDAARQEWAAVLSPVRGTQR